jgi:hypothetical protein
MLVLRRMKLVQPVVTTKPLLKGRIMVNMVRSAESAVSSSSLVKASSVHARLNEQPNAAIMALMERNSTGTRTVPGILRPLMADERTTKKLVRNAMEAYGCQLGFQASSLERNLQQRSLSRFSRSLVSPR